MNKDKLTEFGAMVEFFMLERATTQSTLARRIHMSQSAISLMMYGKRRPSSQIVELMIDELKVPVEQQPEFLLLASGHSKKFVDQVLTRVGIKGQREV